MCLLLEKTLFSSPLQKILCINQEMEHLMGDQLYLVQYSIHYPTYTVCTVPGVKEKVDGYLSQGNQSFWINDMLHSRYISSSKFFSECVQPLCSVKSIFVLYMNTCTSSWLNHLFGNDVAVTAAKSIFPGVLNRNRVLFKLFSYIPYITNAK